MTWEIRQGDVIDRLRGMPPASVHCVVTSPPYYGLRSYGVKGQIGIEPTLGEYIAKLTAVFEEVRRVLRADGTLWLNLGDGYAANGTTGCGSPVDTRYDGRPTRESDRVRGRDPERKAIPTGLKPKDLMMVPARLALALQEAGWWLRSEITWCKPAPMPESVTDRPTAATEKIYLLTKARAYYYDMDAERVAFTEPLAPFKGSTFTEGKTGHNGQGRVSVLPRKQDGHGRRPAGFNGRWDEAEAGGTNPAGRNLWNYWVIGPEPLTLPHFAVFPSELPRRCISLGTSAKGVCAACGAPWKRVVQVVGEQEYHGGSLVKSAALMLEGRGAKSLETSILLDGRTSIKQTLGWRSSCTHAVGAVPALVLDPFSGAGTTGLAALRLQRDYIGIELNADYVEMSRRRIIADAPLLNATSEVTPPMLTALEASG